MSPPERGRRVRPVIDFLDILGAEIIDTFRGEWRLLLAGWAGVAFVVLVVSHLRWVS